ncbi:MAG: ABC exporter membrane fusion protein [Phormidesmis sp.]
MNLGAINQQSSAVSRSSFRWELVLAAVLLGLMGVVGWRLWQLQAAKLEAAQSEVVIPKITTVTALGRLEPAGELVNITAPTSTQESRVDELRVAVGDRIQAGQVIAVLDSRDRLQAALQKAQQQVEIARAQQAQVEAGAKSGEVQAQLAEISRLEAERLGSIATQQATINRIAAEVDNARADYQRYDSLFQQGALSESDRDARRLTLTTTEQRLAEAQATLSRIETTTQQQISQAKATLNRIEEVRPVDLSEATAQVQSAIASVAEAQASLEQTYVKSPSAGQILEIHTRPGETVSSEGIVTLGQTQQMMAIAEVYQNDIAKVQLGQSVEITTPVLAETLAGTVERIGLQVDRQQVVNEDPAANIDAKIVEVTIRLDKASGERVAGLSNLQVTATIQTE